MKHTRKQTALPFNAALLSTLFALSCAAPLPGLAARMAGLRLTGAITSMPGGGKVEIEQRVFHIKAGTHADRDLHKFHMGQMVDVELDGRVDSKTAEVVRIAAHAGS